MQPYVNRKNEKESELKKLREDLEKLPEVKENERCYEIKLKLLKKKKKLLETKINKVKFEIEKLLNSNVVYGGYREDELPDLNTDRVEYNEEKLLNNKIAYEEYKDNNIRSYIDEDQIEKYIEKKKEQIDILEGEIKELEEELEIELEEEEEPDRFNKKKANSYESEDDDDRY